MLSLPAGLLASGEEPKKPRRWSLYHLPLPATSYAMPPKPKMTSSVRRQDNSQYYNELSRCHRTLFDVMSGRSPQRQHPVVVVAPSALAMAVGGGLWWGWSPVVICSTISSRQIEESISILNFFPPKFARTRVESISILNFFPPNRGVDFYFELLPAKSRSRFLF